MTDLDLREPYYDRFDIADAHYWFCANYHSGQNCELYAKRFRISKYFMPSPFATGPDSENAKAIYADLALAELFTPGAKS